MPDFTDIQAGYPWYNGRINQTFVALPGLSIAIDNPLLIKKNTPYQYRPVKKRIVPH
jgi:hypothetical protein